MAFNIFTSIFGNADLNPHEENAANKIEQSIKEDKLINIDFENNHNRDIDNLLYKQIVLLSQRIERLEIEINNLKDILHAVTNNTTPLSSDVIDNKSQMSVSEIIEDDITGQKLFLAPPLPDGSFKDFSYTEHVGKSIYELMTTDGKIGHFSFLQSKDAIATALISISQFIKPACKIVNPNSGIPSRIKTINEGLAIFDECSESWVISQKAVVEFEK